MEDAPNEAGTMVFAMQARTETYLRPNLYWVWISLRPRYLAAELRVLHVNLSNRNHHHRGARNRSDWG
jgi:hypothetical protein